MADLRRKEGRKEGRKVASQPASQQAFVLAAHSVVFGLLHVELPLPRAWPPFLGAKQGVAYITVLRDPVARAVSHFEMGTRRLHIEGVFDGDPLPGATLLDFASRPLTDCRACLRQKARGGGVKAHLLSAETTANGSTTTTTFATSTRGGGEFRHCCRKQWRYTADNYYVRELNGFANLVDCAFGTLTRAHLDEATRRLRSFDVVLITKDLAAAPPVLAHRLGWNLVDAPRKLNAAAGPAASSGHHHHPRAALDALRARNVFDLDLYAEAQRLFRAALAEATRASSG